MNVNEIICAAMQRTGIQDLRNDSFREGLEVLIDAVNVAPQTPQRETRLFAEARRAVMNRLVIDDWWHRKPSIDVDVRRPIFVIGMPRTGTTALVNLLAQDLQRCRVLWHWEINDPVPPAAPDHLLDDPRIAAKTAKWAPVVEALADFPHLERATDPVECVHVLAQDFKSLTWHTSTGSSKYNDWFIDQADLRSAYAHHRRTLQVLQSNGAGGQWILKLPSHALHLEALLSVYPDARFVITHRDPLKALVSMCSYAIMIHEANGNQVERPDIIAATYRQVLESALRSVEFVNRHPEVDIYHVQQDRLAADPVGQVNALRAWAGLPADVDLDLRMRRYLDEDWHHPPGSHHYSAKDFGITRESVDEAFASYIRQFDISLEAR